MTRPTLETFINAIKKKEEVLGERLDEAGVLEVVKDVFRKLRQKTKREQPGNKIFINLTIPYTKNIELLRRYL